MGSGASRSNKVQDAPASEVKNVAPAPKAEAEQAKDSPAGVGTVKETPRGGGKTVKVKDFENLSADEKAALRKKHPTIQIIHFNDVYEIEARQREPVGGSARFVQYVMDLYEEAEKKGDLPPLVLFSGDAYNPSLMSTITKGKHMNPILNALGIKASVFGNHDFDFGLEELGSLIKSTNFPWLMSNAWDVKTKKPLANGIRKMVFHWGGWKIGLMGLIEKEWLDTLATINLDEVDYKDFVEIGREMARELNEVDDVDLVIALTHMRVPNDTILGENVPEIDLILGGHDHHYEVKQIGNSLLVKSGSDFRDLSRIHVNFAGGSHTVKTEHIEIVGTMGENPDIAQVVEQYAGSLREKMDKSIGYTSVPLDTKFASIRTRETNAGNWVVDRIREGTKSDICILNSGTLRSDEIFPVGPIKMKDLVSLVPMLDELVVLGMQGKDVLLALENGVSQWPKMEGRFPQVSGIRFQFDASKPSGSRVILSSVFVGNDPLVLEGKEYQVSTKAYLKLGKDGYDVFTRCKILKSENELPVIPSLLHGYFDKLVKYPDPPANAAPAAAPAQPKPPAQPAHHDDHAKEDHGFFSMFRKKNKAPAASQPEPVPEPAPAPPAPVAAPEPIYTPISPQVEGRIVVINAPEQPAK